MSAKHPLPASAPPWVETQATVTTCTYRADPLRALAFGIPSTRNFRITFDYYAHGRLYSGQFQSATAVPQNTSIPLTYNPLQPQENSLTSSPSLSSGRPPLLAIGIAGSLILSFGWLLVLHACR